MGMDGNLENKDVEGLAVNQILSMPETMEKEHDEAEETEPIDETEKAEDIETIEEAEGIEAKNEEDDLEEGGENEYIDSEDDFDDDESFNMEEVLGNWEDESDEDNGEDGYDDTEDDFDNDESFDMEEVLGNWEDESNTDIGNDGYDDTRDDFDRDVDIKDEEAPRASWELTPEQMAEVTSKTMETMNRMKEEYNLDEHGESLDGNLKRPEGGVEREYGRTYLQQLLEEDD